MGEVGKAWAIALSHKTAALVIASSLLPLNLTASAGAWTPERSVAGKRNPWTIIAVISIATFMVVLDTSIANVALTHIAGSLSASWPSGPVTAR